MDCLLLRVEEAARLLGVSRSAAYNLVADGTIPSVRLGHSIRVPADALKKSIAKLECGSGSDDLAGVDAPLQRGRSTSRSKTPRRKQRTGREVGLLGKEEPDPELT